MLYYENLQLDGMFSGLTIRNITIDACYNDHAYMTIEGTFSPVDREQYLHKSLEAEKLSLLCTGDETRTIFCGVILGTKIQHVGGSYTIEIKAISHTYLLDIGKESKSYQDVSITYGEVIDSELSGRNAAHINCADERDMQIDAFILKYQETCWQFIQRIASHHHHGLLPDMTHNKPAFWIGMPEGRELRQLNEAPDEIVQKPQDVLSLNAIEYALNNRLEYFDLGDRVGVQGKEYRIYKIHAHLDRKDSVMRFDYHLATEKDCAQPRLSNHNIQGLCLSGTVLDRRKDFVKVHLTTTDITQEIDTASWFRLAAFYTAGEDRGWCAMPEIGDTLDLYFPTKNENDCFLREAVCTSFSPLGGRTNNQAKAGLNPYLPGMGKDKTPETIPATKYIDVPNGQSMLLNDELVNLSSKDGFAIISLTSEHTDLMGGKLGLKLKTDGDICLIGENINLGTDETNALNLTSKKSVMFICENSSIYMDHETGHTNFYAIETVW